MGEVRKHIGLVAEKIILYTRVIREFLKELNSTAENLKKRVEDIKNPTLEDVSVHI